MNMILCQSDVKYVYVLSKFHLLIVKSSISVPAIIVISGYVISEKWRTASIYLISEININVYCSTGISGRNESDGMEKVTTM